MYGNDFKNFEGEDSKILVFIVRQNEFFSNLIGNVSRVLAPIECDFALKSIFLL